MQHHALGGARAHLARAQPAHGEVPAGGGTADLLPFAAHLTVPRVPRDAVSRRGNRQGREHGAGGGDRGRPAGHGRGGGHLHGARRRAERPEAARGGRAGQHGEQHALLPVAPAPDAATGTQSRAAGSRAHHLPDCGAEGGRALRGAHGVRQAQREPDAYRVTPRTHGARRIHLFLRPRM